MESRDKLEQNIIDVTMKIYTEFPELAKYISEMPVKMENGNPSGINTQNLKAYYDSLTQLLAEYAKTHAAKPVKVGKENFKFPGYPLYPPSEDIYNQATQKTELNPADLSKKKTPNANPYTPNEKGFRDDMVGDDLDIPGSELDDQRESIGNEDEENNYYSLGGDAHNDLEEDNG